MDLNSSRCRFCLGNGGQSCDIWHVQKSTFYSLDSLCILSNFRLQFGTHGATNLPFGIKREQKWRWCLILLSLVHFNGTVDGCVNTTTGVFKIKAQSKIVNDGKVYQQPWHTLCSFIHTETMSPTMPVTHITHSLHANGACQSSRPHYCLYHGSSTGDPHMQFP